MNDYQSDLKLGKVLLEFKASVDRQESVKFLLGERQERPVLQGIPALLVNSRDILITEEQLDTRVYALVNEDAHSRSWLFAKSSTATTCSREIAG